MIFTSSCIQCVRVFFVIGDTKQVYKSFVFRKSYEKKKFFVMYIVYKKIFVI